MNRLRRGAFTIVELMTVIAIIGIMSAIAYIGFREFSDTLRLQTFSNSLLTAVRSARFQARSDTFPIRLTFDLDQNRLEFSQCKKKVSCDPTNSAQWKEFEDLRRINTPEDIIFYAYSDGSSSYQTGQHHIMILPEDGTSGFGAIHVSLSPPPRESDRCEFKTIALRPRNTPAQYFKYGKYRPFDSSRPECAL